MKTNKTIGWTLVAGAVGVFIPYTVLTIIFDYPNVLRYEPGVILEKFNAGGSTLVLTWFAFALLGTPLLIGYKLIGERILKETTHGSWITTVGIISIIVQMIGLLRWVFVVPVLAHQYVGTTDPSSRFAIETVFTAFHQFAGVMIGEHIGQLFTIVWTIGVILIFARLKVMASWINYFGLASALIYLLAQTELLATAMPGVPVLDWAGFAGSTLWLVWLIIVGVVFIKKPQTDRF